MIEKLYVLILGRLLRNREKYKLTSKQKSQVEALIVKLSEYRKGEHRVVLEDVDFKWRKDL